MSKGQNSKKGSKKVPQKTMLQKKNDKREKKIKKEASDSIINKWN